MIRNIDIDTISDGKRYGYNDMVKLPSGDCKGCFSCCTGMGESIILDPWDIYQMKIGSGMDFNELSEDVIELRLVDGLIMPCIKMNEERDGCAFLNSEGRCSIHKNRPGFCRLFPLGRIYENGSFSYFLQNQECDYKTFAKIKIKKWLNISSYQDYEKFIMHFHDLRKQFEDKFVDGQEIDEERLKQLNMNFLKIFYIMPYDINKDFYVQYYERVDEILKTL